VGKWSDYVGDSKLFVKTAGFSPGVNARRARTIGVAFLGDLSVRDILVVEATDPFLPPGHDSQIEKRRVSVVSGERWVYAHEPARCTRFTHP
jgi:hypothetical protein